MHFMDYDGKSQKQRQEWSIVLMPSSIAVSLLLNPARQTVHDWDHQDIYFICKGSEWSENIFYKLSLLNHGTQMHTLRLTSDFLSVC